MPVSWNSLITIEEHVKFDRFGQWVDIAERPRHYPPLMWMTYEDSPLLVSEAYDLAIKKVVLLMHRHEEDRVVAQVWIPSRKCLEQRI